MYPLHLLMALMLTVLSTHALAYGSTSSSKKACSKPTLTNITPVALTTVAPQSEFSFQTSSSTVSNSIQVVANKLPVEITIREINKGYVVTGKLPATIKKKYVRIDVSAITTNRCNGVDGWLLKMKGQPAAD
ncbi:MAG TPA: hypothetical protein EYG50_03320 [Cycloclasticus sp.]|jgi:hypothetical protein|nr:hypothetical protein [Cycloclasticus sp.]HIL91769.1 hypothetical protein [Cycloclasticus sp.]